MLPIFDLHCDLLAYLAGGNGRTAFDVCARCSLPQLQKGNVAFQTLAIYTETAPGSHAKAQAQVHASKNLSNNLSFGLSCLESSDFTEEISQLSSKAIVEDAIAEKKTAKFTSKSLEYEGVKPKTQVNNNIKFALALENASGLLEEGESFSHIFSRLDNLGPLLYLSLTWNTENRFAGGNFSDVGLKDDGRVLLEYLSGKNIAIDLSHTSDKTAFDILEMIDRKGLQLTPIASHSNFRKIQDQARNLNDEIAREIIRRKGVIGLNLVTKFIGEPFEANIVRMCEHALTLKGVDAFSLGTDFFYDDDIPIASRSSAYFKEGFEDATCYPKLIALLQKHLPREFVEKIAYKNVEGFIHAACR